MPDATATAEATAEEVAAQEATALKAVQKKTDAIIASADRAMEAATADPEDAADEGEERKTETQADEGDAGEGQEEEQSAKSELTWIQKEAARNFGLTEEQAAALGAPVLDQLASARAKLSKGFADLGRRVQEGEQKPGGAAEEAARQSGGEGDGKPWEPPKLTADGYLTDETATTLTTAFAGIAERLQRLEASIGETSTALGEIVDERLAAQFDGFFGELGQGFESLYGKGPMSGFGDEAPEARARQRVITLAEQLMVGAQYAGEPISQRAALEQAHRAFAFDAVQEAERKKLQGKVARRGRQVSRPPTGKARGRKEGPKNDKEAAAELDSFMRERGMTD